MGISSRASSILTRFAGRWSSGSLLEAAHASGPRSTRVQRRRTERNTPICSVGGSLCSRVRFSGVADAMIVSSWSRIGSDAMRDRDTRDTKPFGRAEILARCPESLGWMYTGDLGNYVDVQGLCGLGLHEKPQGCEYKRMIGIIIAQHSCHCQNGSVRCAKHYLARTLRSAGVRLHDPTSLVSGATEGTL